VIDDSNCHCGPCTAMNEPLTLEGDIRYLKAHIETKNRQLADAEKRVDIYREAWRDAESAAIRLDKKNSQLLTRITELEDTIMRSAQEKRIGGLGHNLGLQQENERLKEENKKLREEIERLNTHKARYQEEILQLEQEAETYRIALNKVRVIAEEVGLE